SASGRRPRRTRCWTTLGAERSRRKPLASAGRQACLAASLYLWLVQTTSGLKGRHTLERQHYVVWGGVGGRGRLRIIGRVLRPTTQSLFERVGLWPGMACLDVGCGGGDVAFELARLAGQDGRVVGMDSDATKIELAAREAEQQQLGSVEFQHADI